MIYNETVPETVTKPAVTVSTVATTTTTTTKVASPTSTFTISIETANEGFGYLGKFESGPLLNAKYTTDASQAITLILRPDGSLWHGSKVAMGDIKGGTLQLFFTDSPSVVATRGPLTCVINADKILTCQSGNFGNTKTVIRSGIPNPVIFIAKPDTMKSPIYIPLTLRVNYI
jgi:hypothetical protein